MLKRLVLALAVALLCAAANAQQAIQLPAAKSCFTGSVGLTGVINTLGAITAGSGGAGGTYTASLLGGTGQGAVATIVVSGGGAVTSVTPTNPGIGYTAGDTLTASSSAIGGVTGFSVPVSSTAISGALAGGTVTFYVPGTTTPKSTWQDAGQVTLNTNPVALDGNGCAIIYGNGAYRQVLKDNLGNLVWDQVTTIYPLNPYYAGLAGGSANAITVTDPLFVGSDGQAVTFIAANTNTAAGTLNASGFGALPLLANSASGAAALTAGQVTSGNVYTAVYKSSASSFVLMNPSSPTYSNQPLHLKAYGAVGDNTTDDTSAVNAWLGACSSTTASCYADCGRYKITATITINIPHNGMTLNGCGMYNTTFDFSATPSTLINMYAADGAGAFFGVFSNFNVSVNNAGPAIRIGDVAFAQGMNSLNLTNVDTQNSNATASAEGVEVNYVVSSVFTNVVANNNTHGSALLCRQCVLNNFVGGAFGTSDNAVRMTAGTNAGNKFSAVDFENMCYGAVIDNSGSVSNSFDTVTAGALNGGCGASALVNATAGSGNMFLNPNLGPFNAATAFGAGNTGVNWRSDRYAATTPGFPLTTVQVQDTQGRDVWVTVTGGNVTLINLYDGGGSLAQQIPNSVSSTGVQSILLPSNYSIAITYTGSPGWTWRAAP